MPVSVNWFSVAMAALASPAAVGTSSTMETSILMLALLPSVSVATTLKLSPSELLPLAVACASLPFRV
ncbi:hypothetical protein D3C79_1032510 [compost metagenome]